jgi:hypothetical protein
MTVVILFLLLLLVIPGAIWLASHVYTENCGGWWML